MTQRYKSAILIIGGAFFAFMLIISFLFYKERVLAFDPSFFSFLMIDQGGFSIALGRWGSVFSQLLPLAALKGNSSLSTFLQVFSIAPIINYVIIFLILTLGLKNYRGALALLLSLCLGFRHAFYYTTAELYLGIALSILLWAVILYSDKDEVRRKVKLTICALVLIYIMSYLHQLTIFTIAFVLATEIIGRRRYKDIHLWIVCIIAIGWYLIRIYVLTGSSYENEKIPSIDVFFQQITNLQHLPSTIYFKNFAPSNFWSMFVVFAVSLYCLFRSKNWLYFIFLPLFSLCFLVLILVTYYKGESPLMYENYYTVLGFFAAVAFVFSVDGFFSQRMEITALFLLLVINSKGIYDAHETMSKRVDYLERLVKYGRTQKSKKFLINERNFPWHYAWVDWAVPFETTLLSAIPHPDSVVTFYVTDDMNKYDTLINRENIFLGPKWAVTWFGSQNLNHKYFNFPSSGYAKLNTPQDDTAFHEEKFNKDNILIEIINEKVYSKTDSFLIVPVRLKNTSNFLLASLPSETNPVRLSYHVYNSNGNMIIADGIRTPLEVDLANTYTQGLNVILPKESGKYVIEVDMVTENRRWWNINKRFDLIVK